MIAKLVLLGTLLPAVVWATSQQWNIFTEWNGAPVLHVPVTITLNADDLPDTLKLTVDAPFFNDPAPAADDNANYIGLWDYEVVEVFFLNAANQYLQVEITPRGQYFVLLFDGVRNYKRFSLPLTTTASITGDSWSATAHIPLAYLPQGVNKFNAYATHGTPPNRHYEALSPAPSDALSPDYHALQFFHDLDLDVTIPGYSALPASQVWTNALEGKISYEIQTYWNSTAIEHEPVILTLDGNKEELFLHIDAPFFDDPPPPGQAGEPFFPLYDYEVVEAFFLNNENQYLEVEVGPYGQHLDLLLWTKNGEYNQLRHSLPMVVTTTIKRKRNRWTGTATIPVDYFPPKVSKFNAYSMHIPGPGRHQESLYPQDPTDEIADFHALKYFQPIDLNSVVPGQSERPMSQLWVDTIQGIFRYEVKHEWNSVPIDHDPATITLEGFEAGVELNVTAPFFNDPPPPGGEPGKPYFGLWDYEVVEMFFLNDNEEYLEVEVGPYGEHLLLLLKNQSNAIMHSIPLDYVVTARVNGTNGEPGMWQGSALIPPEYFPPNVTRMNAYAIHGTDDTRVYEALYPAPLDDPNYPAPNFHALDLFQKIDFEFLVVDNSQYSQFWLDAIANSTAPPKAAAPIEQSDESDSNGAFASVSEAVTKTENPPDLDVETNEVIPLETSTIAYEFLETTISQEPIVAQTNRADIDNFVEETNTIQDETASHRELPDVFDITQTFSRLDTTFANELDSTIELESTTGSIEVDSVTVEYNTDFVVPTTPIVATEQEEETTTFVPSELPDISRVPDIPQPELVKEARRQDIAKPTGNLFRPIPMRNIPRPPSPIKVEESTSLETQNANTHFNNPVSGIVQQPLFPPPSFFNQQSSFGQPLLPFGQTPDGNPATAFINGRPVAIQGDTQFPLPPQIRLKKPNPQSLHIPLPHQPHLDHLLDFQEQQKELQQQQQHQAQHSLRHPQEPVTEQSVPQPHQPQLPHPQRLPQETTNDFHQETNEILPNSFITQSPVQQPGHLQDAFFGQSLPVQENEVGFSHPIQSENIPRPVVQNNQQFIHPITAQPIIRPAVPIATVNKIQQSELAIQTLREPQNSQQNIDSPIDLLENVTFSHSENDNQPQQSGFNKNSNTKSEPNQNVVLPLDNQDNIEQPNSNQNILPLPANQNNIEHPNSNQNILPLPANQNNIEHPNLNQNILPLPANQDNIEHPNFNQNILPLPANQNNIEHPNFNQNILPLPDNQANIEHPNFNQNILPLPANQANIEHPDVNPNVALPVPANQDNIKLPDSNQNVIIPSNLNQKVVKPSSQANTVPSNLNQKVVKPSSQANTVPSNLNQKVVKPSSQANTVPSNLNQKVVIPYQANTVSIARPSAAIPFQQYAPPHDLCQTQGLHPDPYRCPIFHECVLENNKWQVYTWRCERGKFFDINSFTCIKGYC